MRQVQFAKLFVFGLVAIATSSLSCLAQPHTRAPAVTTTSRIQDRYCLQSSDLGYPGNCEFSTYEQCMATASGTGAGCGENPQYLFAKQQRN
jgi:hypothetical protein